MDSIQEAPNTLLRPLVELRQVEFTSARGTQLNAPFTYIVACLLLDSTAIHEKMVKMPMVKIS